MTKWTSTDAYLCIFQLQKSLSPLFFQQVGIVLQRCVSTTIQFFMILNTKCVLQIQPHWVRLDKWSGIYFTAKGHGHLLKYIKNINDTYVQSILIVANSCH